MANPPQIIESFARARAYEALAQSLVAEAFRRSRPLAYLVRIHVQELGEVSDLQMAWWLQRTWFMLARREVPHLRSRTSVAMVDDRLAHQVIEAFQKQTDLTPTRAELVQLIASQSLPFMMLDDEDNNLPPNTQLIDLEWRLALTETAEGKAAILDRWLEAVASVSYPVLGLALQRLLDREQFWHARHVGLKQTTELLPWTDAPDWTLDTLPYQVSQRLPASLWGLYRPLIEASFPSQWPDLSALSKTLDVPLMAPSGG